MRHNVEHIRRQGFEILKLVYFRKFNRNTKAESLHFCPAFVYALLAVVLLFTSSNLKMKSKIENRNGVDYLSFTPEGMKFPTTIPVITKGNRDEANAWTWNGSLEAPTVRPSVRTQYANEKGENVVIHYWLNDGICQCLSDCTDGNANTNLSLVDVG